MHWIRLVEITVGAGLLTSLTDWLFAGDWIHKRWTYPEIWRKGAEGPKIALTEPLPFMTCAVFAYLAERLGRTTVTGATKLAFAIWIIGPLPLILTNAAFIKLHRVFATLYSLGWLVKLLIAAVAVGLLLH